MEVSSFNVNSPQHLSKHLPKDVVYMCIGTSAVVADSLGPMVGSMLNDTMEQPLFVYGTFDSTITAVNLSTAYKIIKLLHPDKKVLVIDAAVGTAEEKGKIIFEDAPLRPGAATNKNLGAVGDYSVMGIVAERGLGDFYTSAVDKQLLIKSMAEVICKAINMSYSLSN